MLFVVDNMSVGGVQKALLGVVNKYIADGWEVTVAMLSISGSFLPFLPKCVKVCEIKGFELIKSVLHNPLKENIKGLFKSVHFIPLAQHVYYYINIKLTHSAIKYYLHMFRKIPLFSVQEYDLAVAFAGPDSFIDLYVAIKIKAKEKWGWVHFDVSRFGTDYGITSFCGKHFSRINVVSAEGKQVFDNRFPELSNKTQVAPNIIDVHSILEMAKARVNIQPQMKRKKIILTVGRITVVKGQYMALQSIKKLVDSGYKDIMYWMVGDGNDLDRCQAFVKENKLKDFVYFWHTQVNPYPYMALCDIYVQPSFHEGFCLTLAEVRLFEKEIIATNFVGAKEQLNDYPYPYSIIETSSDAIAEAIAERLK